MKKIFSLLMAMTMLLSATAALAETVQMDAAIPGYQITVTLPEGVTSEVKSDKDWTWVSFTSGPIYDLTVAPSEVLEGKSMKDLTEEEWETFISVLADNAAEPKHSRVTLENGIEFIIVEETTESNDFAIVETVVNGYFICLYGRYGDYAELTAADLETMLQVMGSLTISETAK